MSVKFVISQTRCHSPCHPFQLLKCPSTPPPHNKQHINFNIRPEPGATLHVLITSCMKCPTTPPPHCNNISRSIFAQNPVSLSISSLPVVGSVHLHLMVTTHLYNQYSPRTRCLSASVSDLHTSPPALSTSSSQLILSRNTTSVQFVFISNPV